MGLYLREIRDIHRAIENPYWWELRLFTALNPCITNKDLTILSRDGNRYVRATARAVLQYREGT
jgi:hypothetical protein